MKALRKFLALFGICMVFFAHAAMNFKTEHLKGEEKARYFSYEISYPQFFGHTSDVTSLNEAILRKAQKQLIEFKAKIEPADRLEALSYKIKMPLNLKSNFILIRFEVPYYNQHIVSVRFETNSYYFGSAHPNSNFLVLNYDLNQKKELQMRDIFNSQVNYIEFLSKSSVGLLIDKMKKQHISVEEDDYLAQQIKEGTLPNEENFQFWNFSSKGLLVSFPPYQVAAYVYGPQEIEIPYTKLTQIIKPEFLPQKPKS